MQKYTLFIGIDISKKWIDVCLSQNGNRKQMPHSRFDNNKSGFNKMRSFIKTYAKKQQLSNDWLVCMEHTGVYVLPLCSYLEHQKIDYVLDSALRIQLSLGLRRGKSDKADAADIARYIYLHHGELEPYHLPNDELLEIKNLLALRRRLTKAKVSLTVAAKELKGFTPAVVNHQVSKYSKEICQQLKQQIKEVEKAILKIINENKKLSQLHKLITSVKGVGLMISAHLLVYTNAFTAFQTPRQFACYIGLVPYPYESGTSIKRPDTVSHLANKRLKALISNGAQSAILHDKQIREYFLRKVKEGKNEFLVRNNVKNKLVHRIFAVVKRGTPYVELHQHKA